MTFVPRDGKTVSRPQGSYLNCLYALDSCKFVKLAGQHFQQSVPFAHESNTIRGLQDFVTELQRAMGFRVNAITEIQESFYMLRMKSDLGFIPTGRAGDYVMIYNQ